MYVLEVFSPSCWDGAHTYALSEKHTAKSAEETRREFEQEMRRQFEDDITVKLIGPLPV